MRTVDQVITASVPEALRRFIRESCALAPDAFRPLAPDAVPQPAQRLLVHAHDMTTTLTEFHDSPLHVEVLQRQQTDELYLREVFLRTATEKVVEYGVIAIALDRFTPGQQETILAGRIPLGALLHQFRIPFVSAPLGFFSVAAEELDDCALAAESGATCYGRFNRLARPTGEALAWILEILPSSASR